MDWKEVTPFITDAAIKQCKMICLTVLLSIISVSICSCTAICVKSKMKADEAKYYYLAEELKQNKDK